MITQHKPTLYGFVVGFVLFSALILARTAWGSTAPPDADPGWLATYLSPAGRVILGGIACLGVAWALGLARDRWGWLRRGLVGTLAATVYGAAVAFGVVVAMGGGVEAGLASVGGAFVAGLGLRADPERVTRRAAKDADVEGPPT